MIHKEESPVALAPINLQGGWPTPRLHPAEAMQKASFKLFGSPDVYEKLKYGPELGYEPLRSNIATWLSEVYQHEYTKEAAPTTLDDIVITNGASNGLATILQKFADPEITKSVWMVEPTYFLACPIFRDNGFTRHIRGVPEGRDGVDLEFLRRNLERVDQNITSHNEVSRAQHKTPEKGYPKIYRYILYMIPTFSNPSGTTMSIKAREELIQLAREYDMLVVTDDVYDFLSWAKDEEHDASFESKPEPRLVDVDKTFGTRTTHGNAVSNGSFSKIVAPGVRVGWLQGSSKFVRAMGTVGASVSGGCQGHLGSLIINQMLADGVIQKQLEDVLTPLYRRRYRLMTTTIEELLYPLGVQIVQPAVETIQRGGYFLYIMFSKQGPTASEIAKVALEDFQLRIAPGNIFRVPDDVEGEEKRSQDYLYGARLCWAWHEESEIVEGIERLAEVLQAMSRREVS